MKYELCSNENFLVKGVDAIENSHHRSKGKHPIDTPTNTSSTWSSLGSSAHTTTTVLTVL
jgi:hypothetical protein